MVLTKSELIASLKNEVRILLHLAGKIDRTHIDYRPTAKQRSTLELLRYLSVMGPMLIRMANGQADSAAWSAAQKEADMRDFDQTVATIAGHPQTYEALLAAMGDDAFRVEINDFDGSTTSRGVFITKYVLQGHAAYRTQLFLYLKSCGCHELNTRNLWGGVDSPAMTA
jgi:2-hydroxychromene-2-carboxylate isomerase